MSISSPRATIPCSRPKCIWPWKPPDSPLEALAAVPKCQNYAGILEAGGDGDEGMPDGVLKFQAFPAIEQHADGIEHAANEDQDQSLRRQGRVQLLDRNDRHPAQG